MSDLSECPYEVANRLGLFVVVPGEDEIQLDIDDDESLAHYAAMVKVLESSGVYVYEKSRTVSRGGNWHIVVTLSTGGVLSDYARIALQAALGSDRKRELLSAMRLLLHLDRPPTVFFEEIPKETPIAESIDDDDIPF